MLTEAERVIMALIDEFTHGSRASKNPYGREAVKIGLRYLAEQHNISDYLDAVSILKKREEE